MLARPQVSIAGMADFLGGFGADLNFSQYIQDPTPLTPGSQLCKTAGQVCYASFGVKPTSSRKRLMKCLAEKPTAIATSAMVRA